MPALEYLSQNNLSAYPFKAGRSKQPTNPIEDDWFCDILYVSHIASVRRVHISEIEKISEQLLKIKFSDSDTQLQIGSTVTISSDNFTCHLANTEQPFASASNPFFSVKIVLGQGLPSKAPFYQTYDADETELANSAIVPYRTPVKSLIFEKFVPFSEGGNFSFIPEHVHTYTFPNVPKIELRHNTKFSLNTLNSGYIDVSPGAGAGLYNNCSPSNSVLTINNVSPNAAGTFFINTSSCYSLNLLTAREELALGDTLDFYRLYDVYTASDEITTKDVVSTDHSLLLENFCKPKCPPENIKAFAYYLNRITDAANELTSIAYKETQTAGLGSVADNPRIFNVSAEDFLQPTPFPTCNLLSRNDRFIKYFHEFRKIQIHYSASDVREYDILSVIDENSILLSHAAEISSTKVAFRVLDVGVFSNMNCAILESNAQAATYTLPYFKVKYTSFEALDIQSQYNTYLSISVAIYNPGATLRGFHVVFSNLDSDLIQQGKFKVRRNDYVEQVSDITFDLGCKEYVVVDAIYSVICGNAGGDLNITVFDITDNPDEPTQIGETYTIANINGADCPDTLGRLDTARVLQPEAGYFSKDLDVVSNTTNVEILSQEIPGWLYFPLFPTNGKITLIGANASAYKTSKRYRITYRTYGANAASIISTVLIDYVALPEIISPLSATYTSNSPIILDNITTYDENYPLLAVRATNMRILSSDYSEDLANFKYTLTGAPSGLVFNESTGLLTGKIDSNTAPGSLFELHVSAYNSAGQATNPQIIYLYMLATDPPTISFA